MEVRAEGSRRGFSELGNEMKLTKRSLILWGARAMLPCKTEPHATAKAASRAKSYPARPSALDVEPTRPTRTRRS
jgi:hypothetical protein